MGCRHGPKRSRGRVPPLYPLTRAHEVDSATRWGRHLAAVGRFHFRSIRFGAAAIAASVSGATMELGRSWRTLLMMLLLRPRGAGEVPGHRQQAALKDQRFRWRVPPLYPLTRAHEVDSATRWGRHKHDPLGPPQARRRRFHFRLIRFGAAAIAASVSGRLGGAAAAGRRRHRGDDGARALVANAAAADVAAAAARRRRGTGSSPTGGIERPAV